MSWYLFYFGPIENLSDIFIERIAPVSQHSSCRLCLSWWIQRAPELQQVGGCTPQSCPRTGVRSHQGFLLSFPLVSAHTPGRGLSQGASPRGAAELYVLLLSSPSMGVSALLSDGSHMDFKARDREDLFELLCRAVVMVRMGRQEVRSAHGVSASSGNQTEIILLLTFSLASPRFFQRITESAFHAILTLS